MCGGANEEECGDKYVTFLFSPPNVKDERRAYRGDEGAAGGMPILSAAAVTARDVMMEVISEEETAEAYGGAVRSFDSAAPVVARFRIAKSEACGRGPGMALRGRPMAEAAARALAA